MSLKTITALTAFSFAAIPHMSIAWDGVDSETGEDVEIGGGNLVRTGRDIEVYDYGLGGYRDVEVQSIRRYGGSVEIEVYDHDSGEYRTFEMEDD